MNETMKLQAQHVSIRRYKDQAIEEKLLRQLLTVAQQASTSSFLQAYSVIRIQDKTIRQTIAKWSGDQPYILSAPEFLIFCADLNRLSHAANQHGKEAEKGRTEMFIVSTVDAALYGQNVMLAAESVGLGGVFIGGIRNEADQLSELLSLPDQVYPVFGMCLGYPDQAPQTKPRLPLDVILKTDQYTPDDQALMSAYDQDIKAYYKERTKGKIDHSWTEQVAGKLAGEQRPHMMAFLNKRQINTK